MTSMVAMDVLGGGDMRSYAPKEEAETPSGDGRSDVTHKVIPKKNGVLELVAKNDPRSSREGDTKKLV